MIAILDKYKQNVDFHPIVDFVEASHIRYALTFNPTVYVSHIRQFWSTARIETTEEETKILATIDGKLRIVSESSIRRNLKLNDEAGISSLSDAKLFENLTLMGYNISPNQNPSFSGTIVPFFDSMLVPQGEGSGTPTKPHHTPSHEAQPTSRTTHSSLSLPPVPTEPLPTVIPTDTPQLRHYTKRARIAQSLVLPPVANEPPSSIGDDSQGEACPTDSCLEADQDRATIPKTSTLPSDSTPMVTSLAADEGTQELEINSLKARIKLLEDRDGGVAEQSRDDAPIKGRRLDEGEKAAERVSDDTEEMETVLTSMDVASIITSGGVQVVPTAAEVATATVSIPTSSGVVSTASPTIPTASLIFTTATESTLYTRRKGKETMVESGTPKKKKRMNDQIARDAEIARIHAEEELQMLIDGLDRNNETVAKYLREYYQFATELPIERRIEWISDLATEEVLEEKLKEMMQLVPVEEVYVEALQVKHPIIDWKETLSIRPTTSDKEKELWVELKILFEPDVEDYLWIHTQNLMHALVEWKLYDTCGVHHVLTKYQDIFMPIEKDYPLRKGLEIVMISYKLQGRIVENKMHKAFPLPVKTSHYQKKFPLLVKKVPPAEEKRCRCCEVRTATEVKE
nr:hypothetical protein [Tanacetum cinerariifolium]